jgi:hypothetical protein
LFRRPHISARRSLRQRGNQLVEVAIIFLPLCAMLFGLFDFSVAIFMRATMQSAVREGVRYAVTYRTEPSMCQDESIKSIVKASAAGFLSDPSHDSKIIVRFYDPSDLTTPINGAGSNAPGNVVEVGIEGYSWSWMAPLWRGAGPFNINVYAADRMEGLPGGVAPPCR